MGCPAKTELNRPFCLRNEALMVFHINITKVYQSYKEEDTTKVKTNSVHQFSNMNVQTHRIHGAGIYGNIYHIPSHVSIYYQHHGSVMGNDASRCVEPSGPQVLCPWLPHQLEPDGESHRSDSELWEFLVISG